MLARARGAVNGSNSKSEARSWLISTPFDDMNVRTHLIYHLALKQHCFRRLSVVLCDFRNVSDTYKASQYRPTA